MNIYLLCPKCEEITEGKGSEICTATVDLITCQKCNQTFKCAGCFSKGKAFKKLFRKDLPDDLPDEEISFRIPFDIAKYFHSNDRTGIKNK